jgi:hypothetical protein
MKPKRALVPREHGHADLRSSRRIVLWAALAGWAALGLYLFGRSYWPSTCPPDGLIDLYRCSVRLPERRGWTEAALLTWLWATPILAAMEAGRWLRRRVKG